MAYVQNRSQIFTPSNSGSGLGFSGYAGIASTAVGAIGTLSDLSSFKANLKAQRSADISTAGNIVTSYELQMSQNKEAIENINELLGDKLSERGLDALKEASLLKAASAETGTSGGTTEMSVEEAYLNENMDRANIISSANQQAKDILSSIETNKLSVRSNIDSVLLGGGTIDTTSSALSGLSGGLSGGLNMLNFMTDAQKSEFFGV